MGIVSGNAGNASSATWTGKWIALLLACTAPIAGATWYFVNARAGFGAWICTGVLAMAARLEWEKSNTRWFWTALVASAAFQAPLIIYIPWTKPHWMRGIVYGVGFLDFFFVYGCIKLAERIADQR